MKDNKVKKQIMNNDWNKRNIILCMDGLSFDRHRNCLDKFTSLTLSFTKGFEQALVFQKALSRVIEINGPLNMDFHMLQTVYTVF